MSHRSRRAEIYHSLSTLLGSGVPITRACEAAVSSLTGDLPDAWRGVGDAVAGGSDLRSAVERYPRQFPELDRTLIRVAEESGTLPETFESLASWTSFQDQVRRHVISALMLPFFLVHVSAFVFPLPTLVSGGGTASGYLFSVFSVLAFWYALGIIAYLVFTSASARPWLDRVMLAMPGLGSAVTDIALARFSRSFHSLYQAGMPASECTEIAAATCGNQVVASWLLPGADSAREGHPISEGFHPELPVTFATRWRIGEESGSLDDVTGQLGDELGRDAEWKSGELAKWVPRLIYALIAIQMIVMVFILWSKVIGLR